MPIKNILKFALIALGVLLFLVPQAFAQDKTSIAVILSSPVAAYSEALGGFYRGLDEKGIKYESLEFTLGKGVDVQGVLSGIRGFSPGVIHAVGTSAARLAKEEFPDIPAVFSMVLNPVASGLVKSMRAPGSNMTGASMDIPVRVQFELIKRIKPDTRKIGVIYSKEETGIVVDDAQKAAESMGLKLVRAEVGGAGDVPSALESMVKKTDFLWSVADSRVFTKETVREFLITTLRDKLPFMGLSSPFVRAGALLALEASPFNSGQAAAAITAMVLGGDNPSAIPVAVPDEIRITVNENTARILGIKIPDDIYESAEVVGKKESNKP